MLKIKLGEKREKELMDAPYTVNGVVHHHKAKSKALEGKKKQSIKFHEGLKEDREIYARRKLNSAEHKSFSRHEDKLIK